MRDNHDNWSDGSVADILLTVLVFINYLMHYLMHIHALYTVIYHMFVMHHVHMCALCMYVHVSPEATYVLICVYISCIYCVYCKSIKFAGINVPFLGPATYSRELKFAVMSSCRANVTTCRY